MSVKSKITTTAFLLASFSSVAHAGLIGKTSGENSLNSSINIRNANDTNLLIEEVVKGDIDAVKSLLNQGENINSQDYAGNTALHIAAKTGRSDIARELLKHNAKTDIINKRNLNAFQEAIMAKNINVARVINPNALIGIHTEASLTGLIAATSAVASGGITSPFLIAGGVAAAGAGAAIAAGGGGKKDSAKEDSPGASPPPTRRPPNNGGGNGGNGGRRAPIFYPSEFNQQHGIGQVKADIAYSRGYTGKGVIVGVVDGGVQLDHPDLQANILNSGWDFENNDNDASDDRGHGTHVAGIIAAVKDGRQSRYNMHGIAYNAKILPVKVLDASGSGFTSNIALGIEYAADNGAKVINLSLGGAGVMPDIKASMQYAINKGVFVVAAAGNDGAADPIYPAGYAATINDLTNAAALIAVGAVDKQNNIASFSNRCGVAKNWCMVAPGVGILSTYINNNYAISNGTSMAAPHVSGAIAVLLEQSPNLKADDIYDILLMTATDLGAPGIDDIYGHGLLNLDKATQPVGATSIALSGGGLIGLVKSSITANAAFGDAFSASNASFAILDAYQRAYTVSFSDIVENSASIKFDDIFKFFGDEQFDDEISFGDNIKIGFKTITKNNFNKTNKGDLLKSTRVSLTSDLGSSKLTVNYNVPVAESFGFGAIDAYDNSLSVGKKSSGNPFLGFADNGQSFISEMEGKNFKTKLVSFYGAQESGNNVTGYATDFSYSLNNFNVGLQAGFMNEEGSFLGTKSSGAFAIGEQTSTWFYGVSGQYNISSDINLFGAYNAGISYPQTSAKSLISDISEIQSQSFSLGVTKENNLRRNDKIGLVVSQPLRVSSGSATLDLPIYTSANGSIYRQDFTADLTPSGRETDIEMFYSTSINEVTNLKTGVMYRIQPGHNKDAGSEAIFIIKFKREF